jgi:hypothetical protein
LFDSSSKLLVAFIPEWATTYDTLGFHMNGGMDIHNSQCSTEYQTF